jgi:tripartite-type tricarboxylate transporter receptor subunit TctC
MRIPPTAAGYRIATGSCDNWQDKLANLSSAALRGLLCIVAFGLTGVPLGAQEQSYPTKSIMVIVPFPARGPSDVVARLITDHMARTFGQQKVIENVSGGGGTLGSARIAAAPADGYSLLAGSMGSHVAAPALTPNLKYDTARDFEPIGFTAYSPAVIVARKDFPAADVAEFIAYLRQNREKANQAHGGSSHMACLLFTSQLGLKPILVAYRGTGPAVNDLLAGHVDFLCEQAVSVANQINAGLPKGYVVSGSERIPALAAIPSARAAGIKHDMSIGAGIFAPTGVTREVVGRLAAALNKALEDASVQQSLSELGASIPTRAERNPATFERLVKAVIALGSPILKAASTSSN